ncbi:MAG: hypothetical protein GEV07_12665 [Streptosporangiales bacterium]|nr:hypothetical protein [Streptosporangiales bacterium]
MGPVYPEDGPPARPPNYCEIHLGGEPEELTAELYTVWSAGFADPEAQINLKVDRDWLVEYLRDFGHEPTGRFPDASPLIDELIHRGLLLEFDPEAGDLEQLLSRHRLYPRALGLGSTVHERELFGIGYGSSRFCAVGPDVYQLWSFALTYPTLWDACAGYASGVDADRPPDEEPLHLTADEVARNVAECLPMLVSTKAAFLDPLNYDLPTVPGPVEFPTDGGRSASPGRTPVIVPVGVPMGWDFWEGDPADRPDQYYQLHLGTRYVDLTMEEFLAWHAAADGFQQHVRHQVTKTTLVEHLRSAEGLPNAEDLVAGMLARGLLVEFDPVQGPLRDLFRAVQLFPLGDAYGNTPQRPDLYGLGVEGEILLSIEPEPYMIRSYGLTCASLWDACTALAEGADEGLPPGETPVGLSPEDVARSVAIVLPAMISAGCAFIDPLNYAL